MATWAAGFSAPGSGTGGFGSQQALDAWKATLPQGTSGSTAPPPGTQQQMQGMISQPDPSSVYSDKLQQMSTGQFSPSDPSYQFRVQQGQQSLERSQAAKGMAGGGGAAIELQQYGQQSGATEYQAQFSRMLQAMTGVESQYQSQYSRLATLAGVQLDQQGLNMKQQGQLFDQNQSNSHDAGIGAGLAAGAGGGPGASQPSSMDASIAADKSSWQAQYDANQNATYGPGASWGGGSISGDSSNVGGNGYVSSSGGDYIDVGSGG